ncbi:hypothetical protein D3C74_370710 [compost metagenome]
MAASVTVRVMGPPVSWDSASGTIPSRLVSPTVERTPTSAFHDEGMRIEPPVSVPSPITAKLAAIDAPDPPLDPPDVLPGAYGLVVVPPSELSVVVLTANS